MEILSTGQKIKRARIYKGITLKELCKDKLSISKMSCIENGKIDADEETIKYIADIIEVDYEYLAKDVYEQISGYAKEIDEKKESLNDYNLKAIDIIDYAIEYEYYDLALELMHNLFIYQINKEDYDENQLLISKYYNIYEKSISDRSTLTYFLDIGNYLYKRGEYIEAIVYYTRIIDLGIVSKTDNLELYLKIRLKKAQCLYKAEKYKEVEEILEDIILIEKMNFNNVKSYKVLGLYSLVLIRLLKEDGEKYKKLNLDSISNNDTVLARAHFEYGRAYYSINENEKAINEIKESIRICPNDNSIEYAKFINEIIELIIQHGETEIALENIENSINIAITQNNIKLIEKAYYLKGISLKMEGRYLQAEMYMNLSIDALSKFGSKSESYQRYLDMGNLYYEIGNVYDATKYYSIALSMED